ncbi:MAG: matrixin family metalloprotease [Candidatus Obscuribacterales bacterium]|nr:matrixin family metalloprotease [Candidatus Obscuribacterales bacterium]
MPTKNLRLIQKSSVAFALAAFCLAAASAEEPIVVPPGTSSQVLSAFNEGSKLLAAGKNAEAAEKYELVTKALPNVALAHLNYGVALAKLGKSQAAVVELKKAEKLDPKHPLVLLNLGQTYQMLGQNSDALTCYGNYLKFYPAGAYAAQVKVMQHSIQAQQALTHGKSSIGQDNYLEEALAPGSGKWQKTPVAVFIADGSGTAGYKSEYRDILKEAFAEWAASTESRIAFKYVDKPSDAVIICKWTANPKDLINPLEGGQAYVLRDISGKIVKVDMCILTVNTRSTAAFSRSYLKHVCLHEVGHSLGLVGHSSQPDDVMFSAVNYEAANGKLSERDKKTISLLYPIPATPVVNKRPLEPLKGVNPSFFTDPFPQRGSGLFDKGTDLNVKSAEPKADPAEAPGPPIIPNSNSRLRPDPTEAPGPPMQ